VRTRVCPAPGAAAWALGPAPLCVHSLPHVYPRFAYLFVTGHHAQLDARPHPLLQPSRQLLHDPRLLVAVRDLVGPFPRINRTHISPRPRQSRCPRRAALCNRGKMATHRTILLTPVPRGGIPAGRRSRPSRSRTRKSRPTPPSAGAWAETASPPPWASRARAGPTRRFFPPPSLLLPLPVPTVRSLPPRASPPPVQIGRALPLGWRGAAHASAHTTRRTTGRRRCQGEREPRGRPMLPGSR